MPDEEIPAESPAADGPGETPPDEVPPASVLGRRALLGSVAGAAAAGVVGFGVGTAAADDGGGEPVATEAAEVGVQPVGELVAPDVQAALVDVYDRTSATIRLTDLRVAHELVDDFAPTAHESPGQLGWFVEASGPGAGLVGSPPQEGGIIRLSTGTAPGGRAGIHLGLDQHAGAPVFTMEWRVIIDPAVLGDAGVAFGALASLEDPAGESPGPGAWFALDPAVSDTWLCRAASGGEVAEVDTGRAPNLLPQRYGITSDGAGLLRFWFDKTEIATIGDVVPGDDDRYGQGLVVAGGPAATEALVDVDWFYLRRELPR